MLSTIGRTVCRAVPRAMARSTPAAAAMALAPVDPSKLTVIRQPRPLRKEPYEGLPFGTNLSDHMLTVEWDGKVGWHAPKIVPFGPLTLDPTVSALHYGIQIFEGMKAYKSKEGVRLFRPLDNMKRMVKSAHRLALPEFDPEPMVDLLRELVKLDAEWVPDLRGYSLYMRPTLISTQATLGVAPTNKALFFAITSPVGPYFPTGFAPVKLWAAEKYVRAWAGGTGDVKCGGNYAATILPQVEAMKQGCQQVLWLYGDKKEVTEVGTMNMFMYWVNEAGEKELITAPLDERGIILAGVTRMSILEMARSIGDFKVSEKVFTMAEVEKAVSENRVLEAFGTGTACVVSPIKEIYYNGKDLKIPYEEEFGAGPLTSKLYNDLMDIQYGVKEHSWSILA